MPELPRMLPRPTEELLTSVGTEKTVYVDADDTKVLKVYKKSHEDGNSRVHPDVSYDKEQWMRLLAQEFYLTKIVRLLFPDTIADIHMASVASGAAPQSLHQRIKPASG